MSQATSVNLMIGSRSFTCFPLESAAFINVAAVYVILGVLPDGKTRVLDVGQTSDLGERIAEHPRRPCWLTNCPGGILWVGILPEGEQEVRLEIEKSIRQQFAPPCGER